MVIRSETNGWKGYQKGWRKNGMEDDMDSNMDGMDGRKKNEKFRPSTFKNHQSFIHKVLTTVQQNTRERQNKVESCCSTPANNGYPIITRPID